MQFEDVFMHKLLRTIPKGSIVPDLRMLGAFTH